jgi:DNA-binding transcriptional LysR family regulator
VKPTQAALYLYDQGRELLGQLYRVENELARLAAGQAGRIRIGSFASASATLLPHSIARFLVKRREVEVSLDQGEPHELMPRVIHGELDVALVFRYDLVPAVWPRELRVAETLTEPLLVIASRRHRLAGRPAVRMDQLADEVWVSNDTQAPGHACLVARAGEADFQPNIAFRSNNFDAVRGLVRAGLGVAMIPSLACTPDPEVTVLPVSDGLPRRSIAAVCRRHDDSPLVQAFLAALRDVADAIHTATPVPPRKSAPVPAATPIFVT